MGVLFTLQLEPVVCKVLVCSWPNSKSSVMLCIYVQIRYINEQRWLQYVNISWWVMLTEGSHH